MAVINAIFDALGIAYAFSLPQYCDTWWYMGYAVLLIVIFPVFVKLVKKFGIIVFPMSIGLMLFMGISTSYAFVKYLLSALGGIIIAEYKVFEKIQDALKERHKKLIAIGLTIVLAMILAKLRLRYNNLNYLLDAFLAPLIVWLSYYVIGKVKIFSSILEFLGKHSANMFMIHTFIFYYFFMDFSYSFGNGELILGVLILDTLAISILIELIKKYCGWNKLFQKLIQISNRCIEKIYLLEPKKDSCC